MTFPEILNPLPGFKMYYSEIMQLIFIMVHKAGYSEDGILNLMAYYELMSQFELYQKEIEEHNKQQEAENERMEQQMADMRRSMKANTTNNYNSISNPMKSFNPKI